jgi:ComF family protein
MRADGCKGARRSVESAGVPIARLLDPLRHVVDFCYPRVCTVCNGAGDDRSSELCTGCLDQLEKLEDAPACGRCAMPVAQPGAPCPHCEGHGTKPFQMIVRLGVFDDPLRHLVHKIKYRGCWTLAEFLADRLVEQERTTGLLTETNVLVPVPLYHWRHMSRGYNQAELIARRIGRRRGIKVAKALVRLLNTETQTRFHSKEARFENLRDAFGLLKPRAVQGRHVVLVDDVMTTGATLQSAARVLMEAEPASLSAIVVAIADPRHRGFEQI